MRRLVVRRQAESEIAAAMEWYQARNPAAAQRFADSIEEALLAVQPNPFHHQAIEGEIRRLVMRTFPYSIVYFVAVSEAVVIACVHTSRDPTIWRERLR
jgi:plasmid stabilization system protein ParE